MSSPDEKKVQMVRIGCRQPNGLALDLFKKGFDDGTGFVPTVRDGPVMRLNGPTSHVAAGASDPTGNADAFGTTEIPAAFWTAWVEQNKGKNPLLDGEVVFALDDEGQPVEKSA